MSVSRDVFHAIADPHRRKILDLLSRGDRPVQQLVEAFPISFGAVSQHLKILRDAGLVSSRPEGRRRIYRLEPAALKPVHDWTSIYSRAWRGRFRRLRRLVEERE